MTEPIGVQPVVPANQELGSDLTYFAFAASPAMPPAQVPTQACIGALPDVLVGRYRIESQLGAGGMGTVYLARDLLGEQFGDPDPWLALKILSEDFSAAPDASLLLYSEFALIRRVRHENVLRVHSFEVDTVCQRAFISMELMRGLTLDRLLCERPRGLCGKELHGIVLPLLDALAHSHACGVLHGDVKPGNVMLSEDGLRLFDFGLGQAQEGILPGLAHLDRDRFHAWTPGYAPPEALEGQPLSASADVYSVACVIYELAGGKPPFRRLPSTQARNEHLERELHRPKNLPSHCWPALRNALSFDAAERTVSAACLREVMGRPVSWLQRWIG